jgi:hypothetical protein
MVDPETIGRGPTATAAEADGSGGWEQKGGVAARVSPGAARGSDARGRAIKQVYAFHDKWSIIVLPPTHIIFRKYRYI